MLQIKQISLAVIAGVISTSMIVAQTKVGAHSAQPHFKMSENVKAGDYLEKSIIVKVKPEFAGLCSSSAIEDPAFKSMFAELGGMNLAKVFPHTKAPERPFNERGEKLTDLTLIYEFNYTSFVILEKAINKVALAGIFEYVEPHYIPKIKYTPNDALLSTQYAITNIQAENA
nr:hypothetical protein [Bacteroidota bacterium]